jgi:5-amino-6-(5-phosphoribosylamino)uracil reductase/diaminohydroxyphosphoribosylaminopyrimidine deaminase/5-amino-6-(5-phosphoribosylamino)uracil reductase
MPGTGSTRKTRSVCAARPLVTLHFAQSLDGRIALGPRFPRTILSCTEGTAAAHRARASHDAVLVGINTLLHDDPLLTARGPERARPLRVVLDSSLRLPLSARLLAPAADAGPVLVIGCADRTSHARRLELESAGAEVLLIPAGDCGRVALPAALASLAERGVKRLLVEGGAQVLTSFVRARLADRAEIEIAPLWLGSEATPAFAELGVAELLQAQRLVGTEVERLGSSLLLRGEIAYPAQEAS